MGYRKLDMKADVENDKILMAMFCLFVFYFVVAKKISDIHGF